MASGFGGGALDVHGTQAGDLRGAAEAGFGIDFHIPTPIIRAVCHTNARVDHFGSRLGRGGDGKGV